MPSDVFGIVGSTVAGAFRVEAVVAEGGFAVVYRAYHEGFRAPVALKCLKIPEHMSKDAQARFELQFAAEAELLFKLSAAIPVVVRPLHVEVVPAPDGTLMPFMALEWLEGETLAAVAERRAREGRPQFTLSELVPALTPVARALERAHHWDGPDGPVAIVHRDLKPENIFVARVAGEKVVKILDFGIAKAMSMASQVVGRSSESAGGPYTPVYAAPEQWMPKRFGQTGPWTDVWGLALTMVELLVGRPIIDGDNAAMMGTAIDPVRRPTPRTEHAPIGNAAETVFSKALAVDPSDRYGDVGEFWRDLVKAVNEDRKREGTAPRAAEVSLELAAKPEKFPERAAFASLAPLVSRPPPPTFEPPSLAAELIGRFLLPVGMLLAGIAITVVDGIYAASEGRVFTIGPLRPGWIAGALVLGGIFVALVRLVKSEPEP